MSTTFDRVAPYAPFGCVITVIRRLRERGLPEILTLQEINRVGVSEGNASRTLQALKFLKLVDEEGHRTQTFDRLGRVPTSEYAEVLGEIIKEAYQDVFTIVDPAQATDIEINDAFRYYHPHAQRDRMVTLFMGLCKEVGLVAGGPPETRKRLRKTEIGKYVGPSNLTRKYQVEPSHMLEIADISGTTPTAVKEFALLQGLLQQLPGDRKWTQEKRDRWLQAFTASIDLLIDVEQEHRKDL